MEIRGSVAVVTGGASGLGEATASRLHGEGARVVLLDVNAERGEQVAGGLGEGAVFVATDVTETGQVEAAMKRAVEEFGGLHILVNCAGVSWSRRTVNKDGPYPLEYWRKIIDINLVGTFDCVRNAAVHMANNQPNEDGERGVIINTGSAAATEGQIGQSAYTASKAGVAGMTLPLARDLAVIGVRVCTINPGNFMTPMLAAAPRELIDSLLAQHVFPGRTGKPEEYASLAREIISNPMLNGETIRLDAGVRMAPR